MTQQLERSSESEVAEFVEHLCQWRGTLPLAEHQLLDALLLTTAGKDDAVQAYGLDAVTAKRAALAAVVALGLAIGGSGIPTTVGTAQASELAQRGHQGGGGGNQGGGNHGGGGHQGGGGNQGGGGHQGGGGNQGGGGHQGGGQHAGVHRHWSHVPVSYHHYYGPTYSYAYEWYFNRHISYPHLYQVSYVEPDAGSYPEYYQYEGVYYLFIG